MNASQIAKQLGRRGGLARAKRLAPEQKKRIASLGGKARALSHHAARRIERNFYGMQAVRDLKNIPKVRSVASTSETLPGIYVQNRRLS